LPNNHISKKYGCSKCSNNKKFTTKDYIKKCKEIHGDKYDYSLVNYKNAHTKIIIICPLHGEFKQEANSHIRNIGCPKCKRSKGEEIIDLFLTNTNINFITQKKFDNCKYKRTLPFDFYLPNYNVCIEFDGRQHFELNTNFWGGEKTLKEIQKRDNIKTDFCKKNNLKLYRIKYSDNIYDKLNLIYNDIKKIKTNVKIV
jgi:very-short-patch-repair endonuclease